MGKNKLIALAIIIVLILVPFQWAFIDFDVESRLLQVISMTVVVIGSIIAILMFNKKEPGGESHH